MLKKDNQFFKKLESYKNSIALILEDNQEITYRSLLLKAKKISNIIDKEKKLIFLIGQNDIETITSYISFINKGHTVTFLDSKINYIFLKHLISIYQPSYIFCNNKKINKIRSYNKILDLILIVFIKKIKKL